MTPTPTDPREERSASYPDGASDAEILNYVKNCALTHDLHARIIGNAKAGDIAVAIVGINNALATNSKLAAEVERLKTACEKEFQSVEQLSGENIKLAAEIAELKALLSSYHFDTSNPPAVVKAIIEGNIKDRAELETAKLTLFQTEKRLNEKLRTSLAELEAARKERDSIDAKACELSGLLDDARQDRDTALAAKDAAEKRVAVAANYIRKIEGEWQRVKKLFPEVTKDGWLDLTLNEAIAALIPAPTQEPPAGVIHGVTCEKVCHESANGYLHAPDDDGPYDVDGLKYCGRCHTWLPEPPAGGVTISNDSVNSETQLGPKGHVTAEGANSGQSADPGAVTISSPADVPSEGRGELLPFDLAKALTGAKVVTRNLWEVTEIHIGTCPMYCVVGFINGERRTWTEDGQHVNGRTHSIDLFMLPTEGSGA